MITFKIVVDLKNDKGEIGDLAVHRMVTWPMVPRQGDTLWVAGESCSVEEVYFDTDAEDENRRIEVRTHLEDPVFTDIFENREHGWHQGWHQP